MKRKYVSDMTYVIVHFNTPELTSCLCASIRKFHDDAKIIIFDNSNAKQFTNATLFDVEYLDNTHGQIINFEEFFNNYQIDNYVKKLNNLGSAKHTLTIEYLIKHLNVDDFCLLDSDVLLKRKLDFFDSRYITIGELSNDKHILFNNKVRMKRIFPHCQYLNIKKIKEYNLSYFDCNRITGIDVSKLDYDTGASFYEDVKTYDIKLINLNDYIIHFGAASWEHKDYKKWLLLNKEYWR